jgi:hemoglobin-like flavoprotein
MAAAWPQQWKRSRPTDEAVAIPKVGKLPLHRHRLPGSDGERPMTPQQIDIIRRTHILLLLQQRGVAKVLCRQVLLADPTLRPLVVTGDSNLDHQPVQWLSAVVSLLDKPQLLHKSLHELAQRLGRRWSVSQIARLGQAYLDTLQTCLGPRWNADTAAAWTALHRTVSLHLLAATSQGGQNARCDVVAA